MCVIAVKQKMRHWCGMARDDLHFRLRIPEKLKQQVESAAEQNHRSMTAEIIEVLDNFYNPSPNRVGTLLILHQTTDEPLEIGQIIAGSSLSERSPSKMTARSTISGSWRCRGMIDETAGLFERIF